MQNLKSNIDKLDIDKLKNIPSNLSNSKSKLEKWDVDKLVLFPVDLSKLSDVVKNDVVKEDAYNVKIENTNFATDTTLYTDTALNAKINLVPDDSPTDKNSDNFSGILQYSISSCTVSYHSARPAVLVLFLESAYFVVTTENMAIKKTEKLLKFYLNESKA